MKRRFVIGTVDGSWHSSDWISDEEIRQHLDESEGYLGTDPKSHREVYVDSVDEAFEFMTEFLKHDTSLDTQVFSMDINGIKRHFNVCHIMHWHVETLDKDAWDQ